MRLRAPALLSAQVVPLSTPPLYPLNQITDQIITDSNTILQAFQTNIADTGWFLDPTKLADFKVLTGYTSYIDNGGTDEGRRRTSALSSTRDPLPPRRARKRSIRAIISYARCTRSR